MNVLILTQVGAKPMKISSHSEFRVVCSGICALNPALRDLHFRGRIYKMQEKIKEGGGKKPKIF